MNSDLLKWLIQQFPNFLGLLLLAVMLYMVNEQTNQRFDNQFTLLYTCLTSSGAIR